MGALDEDGEQGPSPVREGQVAAEADVVSVAGAHECRKGDHGHAQ